MLKKTIKYTNFNDEEVEEEFYFNLSKADLVKMEVSQKGGGLKEHLERIIAAEDNGKEIIEEMEAIVRAAYGVKTPDGKKFIKNDQIWEEFKSSEAYSVFFMELVTDSAAAALFVEQVVPKDLQEAVKEAQGQIGTGPELPEVAPEHVGDGTPKKLTPSDVREMDPNELKSGLATGKYVFAEDSP